MEENYIQLKKSNIIKIGIKEEDGTDTHEYLTFDLEDINLPLKYQDCIELHKKNIQNLKHKIVIIEKKEDHKGKKLLSSNEEEKIKAVKEYYDKEIEALDLFLGKGGTRKLLNGREPYITMFDDIAEIIEPIMNKLKSGFEDIDKKIKEKYKQVTNNVLEDKENE